MKKKKKNMNMFEPILNRNIFFGFRLIKVSCCSNELRCIIKDSTCVIHDRFKKILVVLIFFFSRFGFSPKPVNVYTFLLFVVVIDNGWQTNKLQIKSGLIRLSKKKIWSSIWLLKSCVMLGFVRGRNPLWSSHSGELLVNTYSLWDYICGVKIEIVEFHLVPAVT